MCESVVSNSIYTKKKPLSSVRLLKPEEIGYVVGEGMKENPIDVCDDSDKEWFKSENPRITMFIV